MKVEQSEGIKPTESYGDESPDDGLLGIELFSSREQVASEIREIEEKDEIDSLVLRARLTPQETKVVELLRQGDDAAQIAEKLSIKPATVRVIKKNAFSKIKKAKGLG